MKMDDKTKWVTKKLSLRTALASPAVKNANLLHKKGFDDSQTRITNFTKSWTK